MQKVLKREEVKLEETWDLTSIFSNDTLWEEEYESLSKEILEFEKYQNTMTDSAENVYETIKKMEDIGLRFGKVYVYAHLNSDADTTNTKYQTYMAKVMQLNSIISSKTTFVDLKLLELGKEKVEEYLKNENLYIYSFYVKRLFEDEKYKLSQKEEELLANYSPSLGASSKAFSMINNADIKFEDIKDSDGKDYVMNHSRYSSYLESSDRTLRENAYNSMYKAFKGLKNTIATVLEGNTNNHVINARVRGYNSARHAALSANGIDESVYDGLLKTVNEKLPLLHRYVKLRKRVLGLDELKMYDMYIPLVKDTKLEYTFEEAKEIIIEALKPLGKEYGEILEKAFSERWVDYAENEGKRSGAYSSGTYGTKPYILISWRGTFDNLFTLAHELGHSIHSYYTRTSQPFVYGHYTIFLAEVASITNEMLLSNYLAKKYKDNKEVLTYILNHHLDRVKSTLYRQSQFAEFEYEIHNSLEKGIPLTAEFLSSKYDEINRKFYGDAISYDENIRYEWERIPHFYYNFYVYQYSTGISAASAFAKKILEEGNSAVDKYIGFLKAGASDYSLDILKKAGVDMNSPKPIVDCLDTFEKTLDEIEKLI